MCFQQPTRSVQYELQTALVVLLYSSCVLSNSRVFPFPVQKWSWAALQLKEGETPAEEVTVDQLLEALRHSKHASKVWQPRFVSAQHPCCFLSLVVKNASCDNPCTEPPLFISAALQRAAGQGPQAGRRGRQGEADTTCACQFVFCAARVSFHTLALQNPPPPHPR